MECVFSYNTLFVNTFWAAIKDFDSVFVILPYLTLSGLYHNVATSRYLLTWIHNKIVIIAISKYTTFLLDPNDNSLNETYLFLHTHTYTPVPHHRTHYFFFRGGGVMVSSGYTYLTIWPCEYYSHTDAGRPPSSNVSRTKSSKIPSADISSNRELKINIQSRFLLSMCEWATTRRASKI